MIEITPKIDIDRVEEILNKALQWSQSIKVMVKFL
jgi:hypothetical protein